MNEEEARKFLEGDIQFSEQAARVAGGVPGAPTPGELLGRMTPARAEEEFKAANKALGVPLDIESGVGPWEKLMLDLRSNRENQIKYLESKYGSDTVRMSTDGELIVRVPDLENQGKSKDLLVRPHAMKATDFIDLLASVPEIALSIYAMRKGESIPWLGKLKGMTGLTRDAVLSAAGGEAAGAVKDIAANLYDIGTPQIAQTAEERAKRLPGMAAVGVAGGAVPRLWQFAKNPLQGYRGTVQFDALAAQKYFKDKFGIDVPMSIGQSTGAPLFGRSEVFIEKMPGGSGPVRALAQAQEEELRRLQQVMLGQSLPTEEELGKRAIAQLQPKAASAETAVESARRRLGATAENALSQDIGALTTPTRELYKTDTGKAIRDAVVAKRDAAKAEADRLYGLVRTIPGGEGKVFPGESLVDDFKSILKSLPAPSQRVEQPTGLLDIFGNPITTTKTKTAPLREFVPPNVLQRLESVAGLKNPVFSLSDLQQMRREVYDDIAKGEGVPGLGTHYLADIGKTLTKAIDEGITSSQPWP